LTSPAPGPSAGSNERQQEAGTPSWAITIAERSSRAHGRRTLGALLDAAAAELETYGYHGARMARIAKRAGVAHGTIYVYFKDKQDLLAAMQRDADASLRSAMLAMPEISPSAAGLEALTDWAGSVMGVFQRFGPVLQALADALSSDEESVAGREALRSMRASTRLIGSRMAAACPDADVLDPEVAAICIFALIEGASRALYLGQLPAQASVELLGSEIALAVQRTALGAAVVPG
jgi:AcrR family transcriptional regulator